MRLLMVSGDRNVAVGEQGPFYSMQREFSRHFERIDVLCPQPDREVVCTTIHDNVHFHPAPPHFGGVEVNVVVDGAHAHLASGSRAEHVDALEVA